jgi:uncharacterized oxidoreductase
VVTVDAKDLRRIGEAILEAAGATAEEASLILDHCIASHLTGEDNHGIEQVVWYSEWMRDGHLVSGVAPTVEKETDTTILVHGNFNTGHYVSHWTMQRLIEKARTSHVAAASIKYQMHVGRLIDYTRLAADAGMIGLMMCDSGWGPKYVAPVGGRERRLGANPWSMAVPSDLGGVVGFDMTSGSVSGTKITRAVAEGERIPEGWIVDSLGRPTTDPNDFAAGGAMLPMGGTHGLHKGYVLNFMIEALADVLSGMEFREDPTKPTATIDGCFMAVFDVEAFRPLVEWNRDLRGLVEYVKSSAPAEGAPGIFYPGERSHLSSLERADRAIAIPDDVWAKVTAAAAGFGVSDLVSTGHE